MCRVRPEASVYLFLCENILLRNAAVSTRSFSIITSNLQKLDYLRERRGVGHDHEWDEIEVPVVRPSAAIVYITAPPECAVQRVLNARQDLRCYAAAAC